MPKKLTDTDLATLESTATKELELIEEGKNYVREHIALRVFKVVSLVVMQLLFYMLAIGAFVAFMYMMFYTQQKFWIYLALSNTQYANEPIENLVILIKIVRIMMFVCTVLFLIAGWQCGRLRQFVQRANNVQSVFDELLTLIQKRKAKFNV
jgi:small-conductance mechanosensitive channel